MAIVRVSILIISNFGTVWAASDLPRIRTLIESIQKVNVPNPSDDVITPKHPTGTAGSGSTKEQLFEETKRLTKPLEQIVAFNPYAVQS